MPTELTSTGERLPGTTTTAGRYVVFLPVAIGTKPTRSAAGSRTFLSRMHGARAPGPIWQLSRMMLSRASACAGYAAAEDESLTAPVIRATGDQ